MNQLLVEKKWAMPNRWTFTIKPIRELLDQEVRGFVVEPFTGKSEYGSIGNDFNSDMDTLLCHDAIEFLEITSSGIADTLILDWPFGPRQVTECYQSVGMKTSQLMTSAKWWADIKDQVSRIVKVGGKVITFGWNSNGIGKSRGFEQNRILTVAHGGNHNDTITTVETKIRDVEIKDPQYNHRLLKDGTEYRPDKDAQFLKQLGTCPICYKQEKRCVC